MPGVQRILIAGTGTEVGKTYVATLLAAELVRRLGPARVLAVKPVESGGTADAQALDAVTQVHAAPHPLFALAEPISPHLAARRAGIAITADAIASWLTAHERQLTLSDSMLPYVAPVVLIETAGGLFSPLGDSARNADLLDALAPARLLLVAPDGLGVLHALETTLAALALRGRRADWVVLSAPAEPDASTGTNADELRRLRIADPVQVIARGGRDIGPLAAATLA